MTPLRRFILLRFTVLRARDTSFPVDVLFRATFFFFFFNFRGAEAADFEHRRVFWEAILWISSTISLMIESFANEAKISCRLVSGGLLVEGWPGLAIASVDDLIACGD